MRWLAIVPLLSSLVWVQSALAEKLLLTDQERAWIVSHPVVRIAVDPEWKPIEYIENGQYKGLASEYIKKIGQLTGLRFEIGHDAGWGTVTEVLQKKQVDVLPATLRSFTTPSVAAQVNFTQSYFVGTTVVVTRDNGTSIYDLHELNGKSISLKGGGAYQTRVEASFPGINIIPSRTTDEELMAVVDGRADAAVGADAALLPYLRRKYSGVLHVAGAVGSLPVDLSMAVRNDLPLLQSIINKSLSSLSAKETDEMAERWFSGTDYGAPSFQVLFLHYGPHLSFITFSLFVISGLAIHARRQQRRAVQSEKEKSMFLAVLSHEIRSPMSAILASMELLQRSELPKEPRRLLGVASNGADVLLRLLDDVLDISKLEAGGVQLDIAPMDIMELSCSVTDLLMPKALKKGIELELKEDGCIPCRVMLDRMRVGQILHNLIANAVKFTLSGRVTVTLGYEASNQRGSRAVLSLHVIDTGIGMDMAMAQRMFEPYTQASAATARKFGGTGLGLRICRQLVELMNGSIEIHSELNQGTTVSVQLPCELHDSEPLHNLTPRTPTQAGLLKLHVLVVEDTFVNQVVLQAQLDVLGSRYMLAEDGSSALRALDKAQYDIVLLDCDLPDISGYEVARSWREREAIRGLPPTPMLAISASTEESHISTCFEAGMDGVLRKPITLGKLRDAMQLWSNVTFECEDNGGLGTKNLDYSAIVEALEADARRLRAASQVGDVATAAYYAHRLVGACEMLGMDTVAELARSVESRFSQLVDACAEVTRTELDLLDARLAVWTNQSVENKMDRSIMHLPNRDH